MGTGIALFYDQINILAEDATYVKGARSDPDLKISKSVPLFLNYHYFSNTEPDSIKLYCLEICSVFEKLRLFKFSDLVTLLSHCSPGAKYFFLKICCIPL